MMETVKVTYAEQVEDQAEELQLIWAFVRSRIAKGSLTPERGLALIARKAAVLQTLRDAESKRGAAAFVEVLIESGALKDS